MRKQTYTKESIRNYLDESIKENWTQSSINEFNYLLRVISDEKFIPFSNDNMLTIFNNLDIYLKNIEKELLSDKMTEERLVSRATAEYNMLNIKDIILSIKEYYQDKNN